MTPPPNCFGILFRAAAALKRATLLTSWNGNAHVRLGHTSGILTLAKLHALTLKPRSGIGHWTSSSKFDEKPHDIPVPS